MISEMEIEKLNKTMGTVFLDPDQKSPRAQDFEERLSARIVGQERAGFSDRDPGRLCPWFYLVSQSPFQKSCSSSLQGARALRSALVLTRPLLAVYLQCKERSVDDIDASIQSFVCPL